MWQKNSFKKPIDGCTGKETIAVFDFDGTITNRDSFVDFIIYTFGINKFIKEILILFPILLLYKLKIISNHVAKERLFFHFFSGQREDKFYNSCKKYSLQRLNQIIKREALDRINWHLCEGHRLVIVSASLENWITPWAENAGFDDVIATIPEVNNGILTGRFKTKNCYGKEKVRRFLEMYPHLERYIIYFYGDSIGDEPLLRMADKPFYRRFG